MFLHRAKRTLVVCHHKMLTLRIDCQPIVVLNREYQALALGVQIKPVYLKCKGVSNNRYKLIFSKQVNTVSKGICVRVVKSVYEPTHTSLC